MKRWQRKALRRFAGMLIDLADGIRTHGDALMRSTERRRAQPFAFPSKAELMLAEITRQTLLGYCRDLDFLRDPKWPRAVRVLDDQLQTVVGVDLAHGSDSFGYFTSAINRTRPNAD